MLTESNIIFIIVKKNKNIYFKTYHI